MNAYRLYTDDAGESRIVPLDLTLDEYAKSRVSPKHEQSEPAAVDRLVHFHFRPGTAGDWHTAPRRQYMLLRSGELEITTSQGESHVLRAGDLVLIEDTTGKGHLTRAPEPHGAHGVFVHLAGEPG